MKQAALIALGISISFAARAHASADAGMAPAATPDTAVRDGPPQIRKVLRGVVAGVDERNDTIAVRLSPGVTTELKVQDGLLFNAVRYGDQVEVTVEEINGAKTIVRLTEQ